MKALILMVLVCAAHAEQRGSSVGVWFEDGAAIEVYTVSTNSTVVMPKPATGIDQQGVFRGITDGNMGELFAYRINARRVPGSGAVSIRVEPYRAYAATQRTVQAVREFPAVRLGEAVTLEVLYNPSTGEKVYDVFAPIEDPVPGDGGGPVVSGFLPTRRLVFEEMTIRVNGQQLPTPASRMFGSVAKIYVPGHGLFVVDAAELTTHTLDIRRIGQVDGGRLSWTSNGTRVEITSKTNILSSASSGEVWVYHDPGFRPPEGTGGISVQLITGSALGVKREIEKGKAQ